MFKNTDEKYVTKVILKPLLLISVDFWKLLKSQSNKLLFFLTWFTCQLCYGRKSRYILVGGRQTIQLGERFAGGDWKGKGHYGSLDKSIKQKYVSVTKCHKKKLTNLWKDKETIVGIETKFICHTVHNFSS